MNYANYFHYIWEVGVFLFGKLAYFYLGSWREFTPLNSRLISYCSFPRQPYFLFCPPMQRAGFYVISFRLRSFKDIGSGCLATEADRIDGVAKLV